MPKLKASTQNQHQLFRRESYGVCKNGKKGQKLKIIPLNNSPNSEGEMQKKNHYQKVFSGWKWKDSEKKVYLL
jgi:hypothetical protein